MKVLICSSDVVPYRQKSLPRQGNPPPGRRGKCSGADGDVKNNGEKEDVAILKGGVGVGWKILLKSPNYLWRKFFRVDIVAANGR
jgi:hypothetical protein